MLKKVFFLSFIIVSSFLFSEVQLDPVREEVFSNQSQIELLNLKADEIRLFTTEEWKEKGLKDSEIERALARYHQTAAYTQDREDFHEQPHFYFEQRKRALEELIEAAKGKEEVPAVELLRRAENKLAYINSLPHPLHPWISKPQALIEQITPEALPVRNHYWYETLDPLRRFSLPQQHYADLWALSDVPNYFIFLETVEYDPLLQKYRPNNKQKLVLQNDEEREKYRITFKEGLAFRNGELLDSSQSVSHHAREPAFIYVLGRDGEFYGHGHDNFSHASFFAAAPVLGAGEIVAKEGKILFINNKSGHYWPQLPHFLQTLEALKKKLGTLEGIKVNIFQYDRTGVLLWYGVTATFDAEEFLKSEGTALALEADAGWTPLHVAVWNNHLSLADRAYRPEWLDKQDERGNTPLHLAVQQGREEWAALLIGWGTDVSLKNGEGKTPLAFAVNSGDMEIVKLLTDDPYIYLWAAARGGNEDLFREYLQKGEVDSDGNTLLHAAIVPENEAFIESVWEEAFAPLLEVKNNAGMTPLHIAASKGSSRLLRLLIERGADISAVDNNGNTVLHSAVAAGNDDAALYILSLAPPELIHQKNHEGATALHLAAGNSGRPVLDALLESGLAVEEEDNKGETPIFYAIRRGGDKGHFALVWLFKQQADSRHFNNEGQAPIHVAVSLKKEEAFIRLLTYSDDISLPDRQGKLPIEHVNEPNLN